MIRVPAGFIICFIRLAGCLSLLFSPVTLAQESTDARSDASAVERTLGKFGDTYANELRFGPPPSVLERGAMNTYLDSLPGYPTQVDETDGQASKSGEFVAAPIPSLNPTVGWGIGGVVMYVYQPLEAEPETQPWTTGIGGGYAENGSWGAAGFHRMNLERDTWRLLAGAGYASFNYDFYGIGNEAGDNGFFIPLNQRVSGGLVEGLRKVWSKWYVGLRFTYLRSRTSLDIKLPDLGPNVPPLPRLEFLSTISALGLRAQYDSRDDQFYPTDGTLFDFKANYYSDLVGSDFNFQSTTLAYNRYFSLFDRHILAMRGTVEFASDGVPFFALSTFGSHSDLRGYQSGRYRDRVLLAVQGEYRLQLTKRFGMVGFAGIGEVAPDFGGLNVDDLLPSVGGGIRFRLANDNPINLRVDIARGKDETAFYVGVGEAF